MIRLNLTKQEAADLLLSTGRWTITQYWILQNKICMECGENLGYTIFILNKGTIEYCGKCALEKEGILKKHMIAGKGEIIRIDNEALLEKDGKLRIGRIK